MASTSIQTIFLLPLNEDVIAGNGENHPQSRWDWLESELCERFGGFTKLPGICEGKWVDSTGTVITDDSYQWLVAIPKSNLRKMRTFLKEVAFKFKQQCIYFSYQGKVEFVEQFKKSEGAGIGFHFKTYISQLIRNNV